MGAPLISRHRRSSTDRRPAVKTAASWSARHRRAGALHSSQGLAVRQRIDRLRPKLLPVGRHVIVAPLALHPSSWLGRSSADRRAGPEGRQLVGTSSSRLGRFPQPHGIAVRQRIDGLQPKLRPASMHVIVAPWALHPSSRLCLSPADGRPTAKTACSWSGRYRRTLGPPPIFMVLPFVSGSTAYGQNRCQLIGTSSSRLGRSTLPHGFAVRHGSDDPSWRSGVRWSRESEKLAEAGAGRKPVPHPSRPVFRQMHWKRTSPDKPCRPLKANLCGRSRAPKFLKAPPGFFAEMHREKPA